MGVSKPQANTVGTPIRTQIIIIFHYNHKSLQQSQNWEKPKSITQSWDKSRLSWDKLGQLPKTTKRERETKMEHAP